MAAPAAQRRREKMVMEHVIAETPSNAKADAERAAARHGHWTK